jgi:NifB/MoaA-like Fe-S oxidoreductase
VRDLADLHPAVSTAAIVPVGLTRHRERLPALRSLEPVEARALVDTVEGWQAAFLPALDTRFVFLGDEVYLRAGRPLPPAAAYEGFPVAEDGIGLVRRFEDEMGRGRRRPRALTRRVTVVTGEMYGPRLASILASLGAAARVAAVPNELFGRSIGVAGLLAGRDIQRHLAGLDDLGEAVLVPAVAVRDGDGVFLDDATPADLARDLQIAVRVVEPSGPALLRALAARRPR